MIPPSAHSCFRNLISALLLAGLTACAQSPSRPAAPQLAVPAPAGPSTKAGDETKVQQLLGDARRSSNPAVAQKAVEAALEAGDLEAALVATRRWRQLAPSAPEVQRYLAILNLRTGRVAEAAKAFENLVAEPGVKPAQRIAAVGVLLAREKNRSAALQVMRRLTAAYPDVPEGQYALALLSLRLHELALAHVAIDRALALRHEWTAATVLKARIMIASGQAEDALDEVGKLVAASPDDWELRRSFAGLLVQAGEAEKARSEFERVLKAQARDPDTLFALGLLALDANELSKAERYFTLLLETGERSQDAYYYLGEILLDQDDYGNAINFFQRVHRGDYVPDAQIGVARALVHLEGLKRAQAYLASVRERNPDFATDLYLGEATLLQQLGKPDAARKVLDDAVKARPGDNALRYNRAVLAADAGDTLTALVDLRQLAKAEPENPDVLNALGYTLTEATGHYLEALAYIQRALAIKPGAPEILDSLGWVQYRLGDHARALKNLRAAYAGAPDPEIAAHLIEVLWQSGAHEEATALWKKASTADPDSASLRAVARRFKLK